MPHTTLYLPVSIRQRPTSARAAVALSATEADRRRAANVAEHTSAGSGVDADATLSTMAVKEPDRCHDGGWEAALEAVEQLTVAVSRVGDAGALESA
jgi:hypothetical protein